MALRKDDLKKFIVNRDLVRKIATKGGFYISDTKKFLNVLEEVMVEELMKGNRVLVKGVGSWEIIGSERRLHDPRNMQDLGEQELYRVHGRGSVRLARYYKAKKDQEKKEKEEEKKE